MPGRLDLPLAGHQGPPEDPGRIDRSTATSQPIESCPDEVDLLEERSSLPRVDRKHADLPPIGRPRGRKMDKVGTSAVIGGAFESERIFGAMRARASTSSEGARPRIAVVVSSKSGSFAARRAYFRDEVEAGQIVDASMRRWFEEHGFDPVFVPLTIDNFEAVAHDRHLAGLISSCDAVYLAGGDQAKHVKCLLEGDGSDTPVMRAIRKVRAQGGLVAGSSAGAAAQGGLQYGEGSVYRYLVENRLIHQDLASGTLHNEAMPGVGSLQQGLSLLPEEVLVCTHFDQRYRLGRLLVAQHAAAKTQGASVLGLGVDEDTGLFVRGRQGRVVGTHGVFVADASAASYGPGPHFQVEGVRLHYLTDGDRFDLDSGEVRPMKPRTLDSHGGAPCTSNDVLRPGEMTRLIEALVRSGAERAVGYTKESDPRFMFELIRDAKTRCYDDGRRIAATGLLVNVRPC